MQQLDGWNWSCPVWWLCWRETDTTAGHYAYLGLSLQGAD